MRAKRLFCLLRGHDFLTVLFPENEHQLYLRCRRCGRGRGLPSERWRRAPPRRRRHRWDVTEDFGYFGDL